MFYNLNHFSFLLLLVIQIVAYTINVGNFSYLAACMSFCRRLTIMFLHPCFDSSSICSVDNMKSFKD